MIKTPKTKKKDFQVMTSLKMFKVDSDSPPPTIIKCVNKFLSLLQHIKKTLSLKLDIKHSYPPAICHPSMITHEKFSSFFQF